MFKRLLCKIFNHRWKLICFSDRHERLQHVHPLAGCLARCARCGEWWDDMPGSPHRSSRRDH